MKMFQTTRARIKQNKFRGRAERAASQELIGWFDGIGGGVIRALTDYQRYNYEKSLLEMQEGLEALLAITEILQARHAELPARPPDQAISFGPTGL
jgi:hypothetical protein